MTIRQVADGIGVSPETIAEVLALGDVPDDEAARRLDDLAALRRRLATRFGTGAQAWRWASSEPIAGFGGRTALDLLREGRTGDVLAAVDAIDAGVYA